MKINNKKGVILLIHIALSCFCYEGFAQERNAFPKIGNKMPDFTLRDVNYYYKKVVSSGDLKGKWYILDFWIYGCAPCIASFPKVSELVKEFKDKVEIIQVGVGGNELKSFYEMQRSKKNLNIPMAFDLKLADHWQITGYPRIFIVDDKGILRVVTTELSSKKLALLVNKGKDEFIAKDHKEFKKVNPNELYFLNGNGGADTNFLFRSVLVKGDSNYTPRGIPNLNSPKNIMIKGTSKPYQLIVDSDLKKGRFQLLNHPLIALYNTAYFGQYDPPSFSDSLYQEAVLFPSIKNNIPMPILEVKDSTNFIMDFKTNRELYSYSLSMPKERANRESIMRSMQLDLEKFFGYSAQVESREWPVWNLVVENPLLVKSLFSTKKQQTFKFEKDRLVIEKFSSKILLSVIEGQLGLGPPFFDQTNISNEIDIDIQLPRGDRNAIIENLKKYGLNLVKSKKMMKVLVIKDPKI